MVLRFLFLSLFFSLFDSFSFWFYLFFLLVVVDLASALFTYIIFFSLSLLYRLHFVLLICFCFFFSLFSSFLFTIHFDNMPSVFFTLLFLFLLPLLLLWVPVSTSTLAVS